jgi:hypothetical protein
MILLKIEALAINSDEYVKILGRSDAIPTHFQGNGRNHNVPHVPNVDMGRGNGGKMALASEYAATQTHR